MYRIRSLLRQAKQIPWNLIKLFCSTLSHSSSLNKQTSGERMAGAVIFISASRGASAYVYTQWLSKITLQRELSQFDGLIQSCVWSCRPMFLIFIQSIHCANPIIALFSVGHSPLYAALYHYVWNRCNLDVRNVLSDDDAW